MEVLDEKPPQRRFRRSTAASTDSAEMDDDRLSALLDIWKEWMRGDNGPAGYSSRSSVGASTASRACDAMISEMETWQANAVNAAIDSLSLNEQAAVYCVKLATIWKLRESLQDVYLRAREKLKVDLVARGVK